jgi:hypothetical protein
MVINADPGDYKRLLSTLQPGDTMQLAPGKYNRLFLNGLNGNASARITIAGPSSGDQAVILGELGHNTVEIVNCSFLALESLLIDSQHIDGAFGVSAKDGLSNITHDIRLDGNTFVGQDSGQQTVGISTKTPTWGWIIRRNTIIGAGTGLYLGNSDGKDPFIAGLVENNLVMNTIGYNMQIKFQLPRPTVLGMPVGPNSTIIRNNTFVKNDGPSPDGDRPNLLVGGFPDSGPGSDVLYEVYGNLFDHNPREALLQASGRVTIHDNIFVDGQYTALALQNHDLPLKLAHLYNNTVYTSQKGINFGSRALEGDAVVGNLVFAATPIAGLIVNQSNNLVDTLANAANYVNRPSFQLGQTDFYPIPRKCRGTPIDLTGFSTDVAYNLDFNGMPKDTGCGVIFFSLALALRRHRVRGAYAGEGTNPGWQLQLGIKP